MHPVVRKVKNLGGGLIPSVALMCALPMVGHAAAKIEMGEEAYVTIGAGARFAATFKDDSAPDGGSGSDFDIQSIRLYLNGQITDKVGLTFNTEEIYGDGPVDVLDAVLRLEFSDEFNIWMGRHLTPADRIEMNGPYYGLTWNQYTQPLYPSDQGGEAGTYGRDDGVTVWGALSKFQYAVGIFDGLEGEETANQSDDPLFAARFAYNFLNMEDNPGYYTSSTYYGGLGNILTLGVSMQSQSNGTGSKEEPGDFNGYAVDLLSETVLGGGGVITVEAEYKAFDSDYTVATQPVAGDCFCLFDGDSAFISAAYLFAEPVGMGKMQPYVRLVENSPSDGDSSDLAEVGLNYVIKGHSARLNLNYSTGDANISGYQGEDSDTISFGAQFQL